MPRGGNDKLSRVLEGRGWDSRGTQGGFKNTNFTLTISVKIHISYSTTVSESHNVIQFSCYWPTNQILHCIQYTVIMIQDAYVMLAAVYLVMDLTLMLDTWCMTQMPAIFLSLHGPIQVVQNQISTSPPTISKFTLYYSASCDFMLATNWNS